MKRVVVLAVLLLVISQNSWAARAKVEAIAKDPYLSALLMDAQTGKVLFSENADALVYPASVIKLMDLLIVLDRIDKGANKLDEMVQITPEAARIGGSQVYLDPKEQFTIEELLYALMVQSANDAAVALALHIAGSKEGFVTLMNQKAAELGMKNSRFYSVHGLPPSQGQEIDQTTAGDLALLCRALVNRPEALRFTGTKERGFRDNTFMMRNHNHLLDSFAGCDGLKTGYFQAAGFSIAATAVRGGNRVIAIVMGSKDRKVRDAKAGELLGKGLAMLPPKEEPVKTVSPTAPVLPPATAAVVAAPPAKAVPVEAVATQQATSLPETKVVAEKSSFSWLTFMLGMAAGIALCAGGAGLMRRKRPVSGLR